MLRPGPARLPLIAIAASVAIAGAALAPPVRAASPTAVTFEAGNPWTQEVGEVRKSDSRREYTVNAGANKTLQINLLTRDPNVFFKVNNETQDKQLVDTYQTGATTWSTQTTATGDYTIQVYVDPAAMQPREVAKYALQIGMYGKEDLKAPTTKIAFEAGNPWAQASGSLDSAAASHDYTVDIATGKTLAVKLITQEPNIHFKVTGEASGNTLVDSATTSNKDWSAPVAAAGTYTVTVYVDPAMVPPGKQVGYAVQIGRYDTIKAAAASAPAAAGTTGGH